MSETTVLPAPTVAGALLQQWMARWRASDEERAFRAYYVDSTLAMARVGLTIALVLVACICVLDFFLRTPEFWQKTIPYRVAAMMLPLGFALLASYVDSVRTALPYIVSAAVLITGLATFPVGWMAFRSNTPFVFWSLIFTTFYVYVILGLRMRQAACAGVPIFFAYIAIGIMIGAQADKIWYGAVFLGFSNMAGLYASYLLESAARKIFEQQSELRRLSRTDGLTGISNRRTFDNHLANVWRQARRDNCAIAVLLVDIDYFKLYNDCYGHQDGDVAICAVADLLSASINRPLDMVARYGGEEFAVVLYDPAEGFVRDYGEGLVKQVYKLEIPHKGSDCAAIVTISAGAALIFPREGNSAEQIVRTADDALYEAKSLGRNQSVVYKPEWSDGTSVQLPAIAL